MSLERNRPHRRERLAPIAPGEVIDPHDDAGVHRWKRVLDAAIEVVPGFWTSLVDDHADLPVDERVERWIQRWHLPADDPGSAYEHHVVATLARDTIEDVELCRADGEDPSREMYAHPLHLRPDEPLECLWTVGTDVHEVVVDAIGVDLERRLRDDEGLTVLSWNPYRESLSDAAQRLHGYLDAVLKQVAREAAESGHRTPAVPNRHLAWFARWKFGGESIRQIAQDADVEGTSVRHAIDRVADLLVWGHRPRD